MAGYGLIVQGSGATTRLRAIESSIASHNMLDILPVNLEGSNNALTDNYIEFRTSGVMGQFLDLSTLTIDLRARVMELDGSSLADTDHVVLANGLSNTLFKNCTCYFSDKMVESNALFNYHSFFLNGDHHSSRETQFYRSCWCLLSR